MIQEYLFIDSEHKADLENYKCKDVDVKILDIDNSDCWIAVLSKNGDNEKNARVLSKAHEYITSQFNPTVLSNGCSAYYNKALYPHFNEFERKLRKLLYLKSALSADKKASDTIKDLESKEFGEIFTLLFSDTQFVQNVKKAVNDKTWQFTKAEIMKTLQNISESTLWDKLIAEDAVSLLRSDFMRVKDFRNDVMHAHNMDAQSYNSALKLIKSINEQLDTEIGKICEEMSPELQENITFNDAMSEAINSLDSTKRAKAFQEQLEKLQSAISPLQTEGIKAVIEEYTRLLPSLKLEGYTTYLQSPEYEALQRQFQEISKMQADIAPTIEKLQKATATMEQYKAALSPAIIELQKTLQSFQPDSAIVDSLKNLSNKDNN